MRSHLVCTGAIVRAGATVLVAGWMSGCGRPPRPPIMAEAEQASRAPASQSAAALAPEATAHAEKLRRDADEAYTRGDIAGAQILAERALVAFQHAVVLGRLARATEASNRASLALQTAEQALAQTEGEQKRVSAQADDVELRVKVIKDAVPLSAAGPADPAREQARLTASRALALDARLLCTAARMVGTETPALTEAQSTTDDLEKRLASSPRVAPIDQAMRARVQCLFALTTARRAAASTSGLGKADQLLAELSEMGGLTPARDDRGVVVTVRDVFAAAQLTTDARERLGALGRVAQAHPDFPVQVVVHSASTKAKTADERNEGRRRGDAVAKALAEGGATAERIRVEPAGSAHPVLDPAIARSPTRSERVEIVFVDPGG